MSVAIFCVFLMDSGCVKQSAFFGQEIMGRNKIRHGTIVNDIMTS